MDGSEHTHGRDHEAPVPEHGQARDGGRGHGDGQQGHGRERGPRNGRGRGAGRGKGHGQGHGVAHAMAHALHPHGHSSRDRTDAAMEASREGMRTVWLSLAILAGTAAVQAVVVAASGSVALLGDTVHNGADALTALPLGVAFALGRRAATRSYTYGYGRAEDLAGIVIVLAVAASSALAGYEAVDRLLHPRDVDHVGAVALAALVGFVGNEWVAHYRITTGRRIGSAALVADGLHARTDGYTSLAVLLGAAGLAVGWPWADPVVGLAITAAILLVLVDAAREVYRRLMDAVDPALVDAAEDALRGVDGVLGAGRVRMRWVGHALRAEADIVVDPRLTVVQAHALAVAAEHALIHAVPGLAGATVHTDHTAEEGTDPHAPLAHHARA
jgi:cation diffusion facilitator family transporter